MSVQLAERPMSATPPGSTSAAGAMRPSGRATWLIVQGPLCVPGTAAMTAFIEDLENLQVPPPQTSSGRDTDDPAESPTQDTASAVAELRRLSGLTWEQLAELLRVARRSLHFWASGKPMNAANEEHLRRVLAAVRQTDRGSSADNRTMLLEDRQGVIPVDLLAAGEYEDYVAVIGAGRGRPRLGEAPLSPRTRDDRKPRPPEELVGALQDKVHVDKGRLLAATPIRRPKREK